MTAKRCAQLLADLYTTLALLCPCKAVAGAKCRGWWRYVRMWILRVYMSATLLQCREGEREHEPLTVRRRTKRGGMNDDEWMNSTKRTVFAV